MQSVAATASLLPYTPYTAIVGAIGGLIYFIASWVGVEGVDYLWPKFIIIFANHKGSI